MAWTIEQAVSCPRLERVIVSTDSREYATVAKEFGAEVPFMRPDALATAECATEPVLLHALQELEKEGYAPDAVVLLQATSPFRAPETIANAIDSYEKSDADSLFTAVPTTPLMWKNAAEPEPLYDYMNRPRRQDFSPEDQLFRENGSIFITKTTLLKRTGNRLGGKMILYPMENLEAFDIDSNDDFAMAERLVEYWPHR